jgi:hypothetical protein
MTDNTKSAAAAREAAAARFRAATEANLNKDANEINVRFEKAEKLFGQADDHRLAASILLAVAKERCREAKINFRQWCEKNVMQSYETVRKLIHIGVAENREKNSGKLLLADMRATNAQRNKEHRARKKDSAGTTKGLVIEQHAARKGADDSLDASDRMQMDQENSRKIERRNPAKAALRTARWNAKNRGREFSIELSDLPEVPERCPVFGTPLRSDGRTDDRPSLDRIDNSRGYVPGNVIFVSYRANRLKGDATPDELQQLANFYSSLKRHDG